jgi:hypothetical protein
MFVEGCGVWRSDSRSGVYTCSYNRGTKSVYNATDKPLLTVICTRLSKRVHSLIRCFTSMWYLFFAQFRMPRVVVDESWCIDHTEVVEGPMVYILSFDMIF